MNTNAHRNFWLHVCCVTALALLPHHAPAGESPVAPQVLIATEASAFKDRVVARLTETLRDDGYAVTVIPLSALPQLQHEPYRAIVFINTCRAWRPSSEVREFLKTTSAEDRRKLVVLTTANSGKCALDAPGVDAISSASKRTRADAIADHALERIRARLTGN